MSGPIVTAPGAAALPGWYGKIPALGDFASRRLPPAFIAFWDAWLQRQLIASRALPDAHRPAACPPGPAWRFLLMPGACGAACWAGLLVPSRDRVGRCFPLTIALALDPKPETAAAVLAADDWFDALEAIALSGQEADASPEWLDAALLATPFGGAAPSASQSDVAAGAAGPTLWWQKGGPNAPARLLAFCGMPAADAAGILLTGAR